MRLSRKNTELLRRSWLIAYKRGLSLEKMRYSYLSREHSFSSKSIESVEIAQIVYDGVITACSKITERNLKILDEFNEIAELIEKKEKYDKYLRFIPFAFLKRNKKLTLKLNSYLDRWSAREPGWPDV